MTKSITSLLFLVSLTVLMFSCGKEDPFIPEEPELITTLTYTLTPMAGGTDVVMSFVDLDGDGAGAPTVTGGTLAANQTYTGSIVLLNETEDPVEDITEEVAEEDKEHQMFFSTNVEGMSIEYLDEDDDGRPVGLSTRLTTGAAGSGTLTITLLHEPDKGAQGVADGIITNAGGETDIRVALPVDVQ